MVIFVGSAFFVLDPHNTSGAIASSTFSQSFSVNPTPGTYGSNRNYLLDDNGTALQNFATTVTPSGFMAGTSNPAANLWNYSIQMNSFNPVGYPVDTMQYVAHVQVSGTAGNLLVGLELYYVFHGGAVFSSLPPPVNIPESSFKGAVITISTTTLPNGNVISASASMTPPGGLSQIIGSVSVPVNFQAPAVAYETNIVGFASGGIATFTQAAGTISYSSSGPMGWTTSVGPIGLSYTSSKADYGTNEQSNLAYGSVSSSAVITSSTIITSSCQNCQSSLNPVITPVSIANGHFDLGPITYRTDFRTGFTFNVTGSQSLTMGLPIGCVPLSNLFNSTVSSLQCSTANFFFKPEGYQTLITIQGTGTGTPVCLPISGVGGQIAFNATSNNNQAQLGADILDWSDIPASMNPSFNSVSSQLCFTPPIGPYSVDPVAIDGTGQCVVGVGNNCNASLTTANGPDVIIVMEHDSANTCNTPTSASFTFHLRASSTGGDGDCVKEYYDVAASSGTFTITCNWASQTSGYCSVFGISGAASGCSGGGTGCFDPNVSLPGQCNAGGISSNPHCVISTSNANDILLGGASEGNNHNWTPGTGFTAITAASGSTNQCSPSGAQNRRCNQYEVVSSTQSSLSVTITLNTQDSFWDMTADAIKSSTIVTTVSFSPSISLSAVFSPSVTLSYSPSISLSPVFSPSLTQSFSTGVILSPTFNPTIGETFSVSLQLIPVLAVANATATTTTITNTSTVNTGAIIGGREFDTLIPVGILLVLGVIVGGAAVLRYRSWERSP